MTPSILRPPLTPNATTGTRFGRASPHPPSRINLLMLPSTNPLSLLSTHSLSHQQELEFYEDNYATSRVQSFILTPKPGKSLLTPEAGAETRPIVSSMQELSVE